MSESDIQLFYVDNGFGWKLALRRYSVKSKLNRSLNPVAILPGYGMNSFIFTYHPDGPSMADTFAKQGFEFWTIDLRAQGDSVCCGGSKNYTLRDVGIHDLSVVLSFILEHTHTKGSRVDLIGCSLGATYAFIQAGLVDEHQIGALVAIGGPLRWVTVHPLMRIASFSPKLLERINFSGTRQMARIALPFLANHLPRVLSPYMQASHVNLDSVESLTRTVEDPRASINAEISKWIKTRDLLIDGRNVTAALGGFTGPFFCTYGNADGLVSAKNALSAFKAVGSSKKKFLELGTGSIKMAHADPYISRYSHSMVFQPISDWFLSLYQ